MALRDSLGIWVAESLLPPNRASPTHPCRLGSSQSTTEVVTTQKLGGAWTKWASIVPKLDRGIQEDPFMYIDRKGNWHVINHACECAAAGDSSAGICFAP